MNRNTTVASLGMRAHLAFQAFALRNDYTPSEEEKLMILRTEGLADELEEAMFKNEQVLPEGTEAA
ncbi:hypothetical protein EHQ12_04115 [Leptospira gomenensis]|uniref:Uncharacterized protein n=1 Tax=Leptospira gomenensis TaxID=2484974 RepID=A0A5F1YH59_9LEPT|nr:hypothetical protein [Leptospira gomenensis]TGK36200.1 hypothetical protein EHQ17_04605 [Leptospira gomenensis]TGK42762.1 hypothetical protein EHQ07_13895 [Leptospira gomenensis]TGK42950.1 hypothetical protein EHQ12_04115 [Leptospira gomenensis]TGK54961.1 hypothetical protein EHQ13_18370 [Leptospira gomenensis]